MFEQPLHIAIIIGSTREGRFGDTVGAWFAARAREREDVTIDVIDLAAVEVPPHLTDDPGPAVDALAERLHAAEAFVIVTPEYNHSFPASLKQAIDWFHVEWQAKPVGFVSYGGRAGGLLAVEHLRLVFAELHAMTIRDTVTFHGAMAAFDETGHPLERDSAARRAQGLLDCLTWWGEALRTARAARPYAA